MRVSTPQRRHPITLVALVTLTLIVAVAVGAMLLVWAKTGDTTSPPRPSSTIYAHPLDSHRLGPATDATPNPWAANDCAVLLDVFGEYAQAYGC